MPLLRTPRSRAATSVRALSRWPFPVRTVAHVICQLLRDLQEGTPTADRPSILLTVPCRSSLGGRGER